MSDLSVKYLGLALQSPVIAGSSTNTMDVDKVKALADAGVGAVVMKSIFEEQIRADVSDMYDSLADQVHPEALEYLKADLPMRMGPTAYLEKLEALKKSVSIPVLASVNCVTEREWTDFAKSVESAGADAIEVNVYDIPDAPGVTAADLEARHQGILAGVKAAVSIPVSIKIGAFYTSTLNMVTRLAENGADGVVMFNRFFQPDIDTESVALRNAVSMSRPEDIRLPLRWVAICRDHVACSLCLSGGVHNAEGAIKGVLAGADAVQICSVLYQQDVGAARAIVDGLNQWLDRKGYASVGDARGLLRQGALTGQGGYERAQYMKTLVGLE